MPNAVISDLQNRDISDGDYELLLQLDRYCSAMTSFQSLAFVNKERMSKELLLVVKMMTRKTVNAEFTGEV